jgi:hypothetical protein
MIERARCGHQRREAYNTHPGKDFLHLTNL